MSMVRVGLSVVLLASSSAFAGKIEGNDVIKEPKKQMLAAGLGAVGKTKRVIVPSLQLRVLWTGDAAAGKTISFRKGVSLKVKYALSGLTKEDLQGFSKTLYDDLVAKLRAAGWEVLTYDDVKADVAGVDRAKLDEKLGLPIQSGEGGTEHYAVAAPSDEMQFKEALQGWTWPFRKIAKEKDANVFVPVYTVRCPRPSAQATQSNAAGGDVRIEAKVGLQPFLAFTKPNGLVLQFINPKGAMGFVANNDWLRMTEQAGVAEQVDESAPEFEGTLSWFFKNVVAGNSDSRDYKSRYALVAFRVDKPVYSEALLKGAEAFNDVAARMTAAELK
jgi:hypothetical protein